MTWRGLKAATNLKKQIAKCKTPESRQAAHRVFGPAARRKTAKDSNHEGREEKALICGLSSIENPE